MGSFKGFLQTLLGEAVIDAPNGIFVKVIPINCDQALLLKYFAALDPMVQDFHATVVYTKSPLKSIALPAIDRHQRFIGRITAIEYWEGHDKEGYIVAKMRSDDLDTLHTQFADALGDAALDGYKDSLFTFPNYQPHVTLCNPVPDISQFKTAMADLNVKLANQPLQIAFYYGGYTLLDPANEE